mgnify:FL=1|tara:strand:- start:24338 stop:25132 length:795 start_codon:yes stop_codon:yes gene_type:complete
MEVTCRNRTFDVYTVEEAEHLKIPYTNEWRKADEGDWILTSDDKVLQVISRRKVVRKDKKKDIEHIRIGYGEVPTYKPSIYAKKYPDWHWDKGHRYDYTRDVKPTVLQTSFINNLMHYGDMSEDGMWSPDSIISCYQNIYRDNNPTSSLKRGMAILRKERVKEHMSELMKDKLDDVGVTDDYLARKMKAFIEDEEIPAGVRFNALKSATELRGHFEKTREVEEGRTVIMLSDGDKKMLAEARVALSDKDINKLIKEGGFSGTES